MICSPQAFDWMHALNILGGKYKYVTLNVLSFLYQAHLKSKAGKMRKSLQIITQRGSFDVKCCFCFVAQCSHAEKVSLVEVLACMLEVIYFPL